MTPAKVVEFAEPTLSVLLPSRTDDPATPLRSWIVLLPVPAEMLKAAPAPARLTPLDMAMLPAFVQPERAVGADRGGAGIGVGAAQDLGGAARDRERAACAAADAAIGDDAGERRVAGNKHLAAPG